MPLSAETPAPARATTRPRPGLSSAAMTSLLLGLLLLATAAGPGATSPVRVGDLVPLELPGGLLRAERASAALDVALADPECDPAGLELRRGEAGVALHLCGAKLLEVTPADAQWEGRTVDETGERWAEALRVAFRQEKARHYPGELLRRASAGLVYPLLLLGALLLVRVVFRRWRTRLLDPPEGARGLTFGPLVLLATRAERGFAALLLRVVALVVYLLLGYAFVVALFRQIPLTETWARAMVAPLGELAGALGGGVLLLLPRLVLAAALIIGARLLLRAIGRLFDQVRRGRSGAGRFLSPETAAPAELTARAGVVVTTLFLATLLVPGSGGVALQLALLLVGLAGAWGAAGLVGSVLGGLFTLAVRPFHRGDRVRLGGHVGEVAWSGLVHVRLKRDDGGTVVIPNRHLLEQGVEVLGAARRLAGEVVVTAPRGQEAAAGLIRHAAVEAGLRREEGRVDLQAVRDGRLVFRIDWPLQGEGGAEARAAFLRGLLEHGPGLQVEVHSALAEDPRAP